MTTVQRAHVRSGVRFGVRFDVRFDVRFGGRFGVQKHHFVDSSLFALEQPEGKRSAVN